MNRLPILLVALLAFVVAACTSEGASPSTAASEAPASASASVEPTESAAASESAPSGTTGAIPSFDLNGDPELAARFPETVGGQPLQIQSMRGDTFNAMGGEDPAFQEFLDSIGADLSDVSVAFGGVVSGETFLSVGAFRVLGASEEELEREFIAASEEAGDVSGLTESSIGGKDVWTATDPSGQTDGSIFIYTKDDTLYFLTGTEEQAVEILEALP